LQPNYSGNKRRKEEARRKKQEEKRNKRLNQKNASHASSENLPAPDNNLGESVTPPNEEQALS